MEFVGLMNSARVHYSWENRSKVGAKKKKKKKKRKTRNSENAEVKSWTQTDTKITIT